MLCTVIPSEHAKLEILSAYTMLDELIEQMVLDIPSELILLEIPF
jgi:hypothetical protein